MALLRIKKELLDLQKNPFTQFSAEPVDDDLFQLKATLIGPPETLYKNKNSTLSFFFHPNTQSNHQSLNISQISTTDT